MITIAYSMMTLAKVTGLQSNTDVVTLLTNTLVIEIHGRSTAD